MTQHASSEELELILEIGLRIGSSGDLNRLLETTVAGIKKTMGTSSCAILLKEDSHLVIRAVTGYPETIIGRRIPLGQGITGRCALERKETIVPDLSTCSEYIHLGAGTFGSELDVPIVFADRVLGVLNAQSAKTNAFGERDLRLMQILGGQIGVGLHNAQVRAQLELVQQIGVRIAAIMKPDELFPSLVEEIRERLHFHSCAILLREDDDLVMRAATGQFPLTLIGTKIPIDRGITGQCARERRIVNVGDVQQDPSYIASGIEEVRSEIAAPVIFRDRLLGVLTVESQARDAFDEDDARLLSILSAQVAVGIHNARTYAEAEAQAVTDALTGLYNYRYFHDRLAGEMTRSARYDHALSLVMIDLDHFKAVNDRHGHLAGDDLLREVAQALKRNIRRYDEASVMKGAEIDVASRYGGDEFIVIMPETPVEGAAIAAERLRTAVAGEAGPRAGLTGERGWPARITASIGVAGYRVGENVETFVRRADEAAYESKKGGRDRVTVR